ncbi:3-hydroxyacyl-ACP dehydratase FabZ [Alphaproteobacteria bacterium]|nr:3-hydroxyacyl-ACP dehydratase FabZ [Alphaproteobacteria bacterium]
MTQTFTMDYRDIEAAIPHRPPFLLIDKVIDIVPGQSATGIKAVSGGEPYFAGHFPGHPILPGVLIVEALAQVASCIFAYTMPGEVQDNLFFLTTVDKTKFRKSVHPGDMLHLKVEIVGGKGPLKKFKGIAEVDGKKMAEAELSAMVVPRNK